MAGLGRPTSGLSSKFLTCLRSYPILSPIFLHLKFHFLFFLIPIEVFLLLYSLLVFSNVSENIKEKKIIKAITEHQTPNEELKGKILENFIKEFEIETITLTNGMCFGEWGLLYSIPRTASIYASEDTDLFYLEKEFFNKILFSKFLKNDYEKIHFLIHKFPIFRKGFKIRHIFSIVLCIKREFNDSRFFFVYIIHKNFIFYNTYREIILIWQKDNISVFHILLHLMDSKIFI